MRTSPTRLISVAFALGAAACAAGATSRLRAGDRSVQSFNLALRADRTNIKTYDAEAAVAAYAEAERLAAPNSEEWQQARARRCFAAQLVSLGSDRMVRTHGKPGPSDLEALQRCGIWSLYESLRLLGLPERAASFEDLFHSDEAALQAYRSYAERGARGLHHLRRDVLRRLTTLARPIGCRPLAGLDAKLERACASLASRVAASEAGREDSARARWETSSAFDCKVLWSSRWNHIKAACQAEPARGLSLLLEESRQLAISALAPELVEPRTNPGSAVERLNMFRTLCRALKGSRAAEAAAPRCRALLAEAAAASLDVVDARLAAEPAFAPLVRDATWRRVEVVCALTPVAGEAAALAPVLARCDRLLEVGVTRARREKATSDVAFALRPFALAGPAVPATREAFARARAEETQRRLAAFTKVDEIRLGAAKDRAWIEARMDACRLRADDWVAVSCAQIVRPILERWRREGRLRDALALARQGLPALADDVAALQPIATLCADGFSPDAARVCQPAPCPEREMKRQPDGRCVLPACPAGLVRDRGTGSCGTPCGPAALASGTGNGCARPSGFLAYLEDDSFGYAHARSAMFALEPPDAPQRLRITVSGRPAMQLACDRAALAGFLRDMRTPADSRDRSGSAFALLRCDGGTLYMERVRASYVTYTNPTTGQQTVGYQSNYEHTIEIYRPDTRPRAKGSASEEAARRHVEDQQRFRRGKEDGTILNAIRAAHDKIAAGTTR